MLQNLITSSPYSIYLSGIFAFIITRNPQFIIFTVLAIIMGDAFNFIEKLAAKSIMKGTSLERIGRRPSACGSRSGKNCSGCGIYPGCKKSKATWGMPSGHAQITSLSAMYWSLYIWENKTENTQAIISIIALWILAAIVWAQRVYSRCHSMLQVTFGAIIGALFGFIAYQYISKSILKLTSS